MYVFLLSVLLIVDRLRHLACRALPYFVSAVLAVVFLPMVLLGASGLFVWRRLVARPDAPSGQGSPSRQRRWLVGLWLLAALQYGGAAIVLRADPLLLYLLVQLSWLSAVLLSILEPGQGALVAGPVSEGGGPMLLAVALTAVLPGSLLVAHILPYWPRLWRRGSSPTIYEAPGVEVPPHVARRAAHGIVAPAQGWGLGYDPDGQEVTVDDGEARHHTLVCGTPGSGKTNVLGLILEGAGSRCPVVVIDGKGSAVLRRAVEAVPGSIVWTIGGDVTWDALRGDPTAFAGKLLAAESFPPQAGVYEAAAFRHVQSIGRLLALEGRPRDPRFVAELLQPPAMRRYLRHLDARFGETARPVLDGVRRTLEQMGQAQREGVAGFDSRFGRFVEGTAGRGLGAGPGALVLEEAIRAGRTVLFSLDASTYPYEAAKVGAWLLLDLIAIAGRLQAEDWAARHATQVYVLIDELTGLGREGAHVVPLLARGREAGVACVLATQGLADLDRAGPTIAQQVLQNTAVKIVLRQGSARDAERWAGELGQYEREEASRLVDGRGRSLGQEYRRWQRVDYVSASALRALGTGDAILSVAPLGHLPRRLEALRVAQARVMHPPERPAEEGGR